MKRAESFIEKVERLIRSGTKVLDLGAGRGQFAERFAKLGATVTAVDRNPGPAGLSNSVEWVTSDVRTYLRKLPTTAVYDLIFARNVIQFLGPREAKSLVPVFERHLAPGGTLSVPVNRAQLGGTLAISTFYRDPDPPFETPFASYWSADELARLFERWKIDHLESFEHDGTDMAGHPRHFFITELIAERQRTTADRARKRS